MKFGILGAGQLAQMMAIAGREVNDEFRFLSDDPNSCSAPYGDLIVSSYDDVEAQNKLAQWADVVTYEFENVSGKAVANIETQVPVHPSSSALAVSSDRLLEKTLFNSQQVGTADFCAVSSAEELVDAFNELARPCILKTRSEGYDGKGQAVIRSLDDIAAAWDSVGGVPCILEAMVPFDREISVIAARSPSGEIAYYPISENSHREGILRLSVALQNDPMQAKAESMVKRLMEELNYVGVIALELFQVGDELLANEFAPRVHNTGHWTIEGAATSQFKNHLLAIADHKLGSTAVSTDVAMINLIGTVPEQELLAVVPAACLHAYGKSDRANRKVGHVTLVRASNQSLVAFKADVAKLLAVVGESALSGGMLD
ncbi:MAG: 5-(carboxyamino)imidazole ribonucleotide synthase [Pseudomonadales bacterium]|jgi:5-(carboxyamino)imidazole ribonucleotide synthase